jgi:hypothetical protein
MDVTLSYYYNLVFYVVSFRVFFPLTILYEFLVSHCDLHYEVWLLNNETVFIKNIVLKFMYVASYLLQRSPLGLLYSAACIPSMRGTFLEIILCEPFW